jgi:aryl-phospho-beta-D-glucosidase BglC (GH1 family)
MIWRKVSAVTCALALSALALVGGTLATQSASAATSMCTVSYSLTNSWPGGFQAGISITNNGPALTSWTLAFTFPNDQTVSNGWSATFTQNGQDVTAASESYNGALATGASVSVGFVGAVGPVDNSPTYFTVNGYACNGATQVPSVELTSPSANSGYAPGASIAIDATASEPTASITKVEILETSALPSGAPANPTVLATETASPYNFTWADVGAGYYILTAEAFDSSGNTATSAPITVSVVPTTSTAPQLQVSGDKLVNASGQTVVLHGVDRSGTEYECVQGYGIFDGPNTQASITAMKEWGVNAVRVPLNEACWNAESYVNSAYAGANYQSAIKAYVNLLNENGIVAILDLHWTDGAYSGPSSGCGSAQAVCQKPMPDAAEAIPFWTSVASAFKGNDSVIFDLFNEPYASRADSNNTTEGWQCWETGSPCTGISYPVAGMQQMVNAVRGTGANNVIMLGGEEYANDLTDWLTYEPTDPDHDLVASWHSYNFNTCDTQSCWTSEVAPVAASVPVVAGEIGENDCAGTYIDSLTTWLESAGISFLAWAWNADFNCSSGPGLITDYTGTPTAYGAAYHAILLSLTP